MFITRIFAVLKLSVSPIVTFVQETYQYKKDMELAEEFNVLIDRSQDKEYLRKNCISGGELIEQRMDTIIEVGKRLRERGFNKEADQVNSFVNAVDLEHRNAEALITIIAPVRLKLISSKNVGAIYDLIMRLKIIFKKSLGLLCPRNAHINEMLLKKHKRS